MPTTLKDEAAIVGIGQTEFSKNSGRSEVQLASEAIAAAIRDAGLEPSQIDGLTTFTMDTSDEIEVARSVGIGDLTFFSRTPYGGGAAIGVMHQAVMAVATGSAKYVVVYRDLNGRSGQRYSEGVGSGPTTSDLIHWSWYMPWGLMTPASWVAMFATRYMHETGTKSTVSTVAETMPPNTAVPTAWRLAAPAPAATSRGRVPKTKETVVMSRGRKRSTAASTAASPISLPSARISRANSTIRIEVLLARPISRTTPIWV